MITFYMIPEVIPNPKSIFENHFPRYHPKTFKEGERCEKIFSFLENSVLEDKQDLSDAQDPQTRGKCRAYSV